MSFFANLLGGTLQGVGAGMSAMAADEEKLAAQRALLQDKQQAALELQQQRTADRQWQQEQMRVGSAGGAGSGKGFNLMEEAARARTPEQRQDLVNRVRAVHEDAGLRLADVGFGMPVMNAVAPTAGDFARYDRAGSMDAAPPTTTLERAAYDREKGAQALQRLYTLFLDPGKLDVHARGERQFGLNDRGEASAVAVEQGGGSALDAAAAFQRSSAVQPERPSERPRPEPALRPTAPVQIGEAGTGSRVGASTSAGARRPLSSAPQDGTVVRDASGQQYIVRNGRPGAPGESAVMDWSRFELVEEPEVSNAGIDWSAFELVALGPGDGRQATSMVNMEPAARAQDGRKVDDPRRTDAPRQASILLDAADQAYGLVKGAAAAVMPWMRPAIEASNGPRPEWKSVLEGPDVVGDARGMDLAEAERLSRRDYAEAVEQRQRIANSPQMRAPTPLNRVQAYAEANPVKAALKQGAASSLAGTLNVPSVAAGLVTEGVNKVLVDGGGSPVFGRVPNMPLVDDLRQMSEGYASTLSRQGPAQAWDNGEFGRWMTVQLAGNSCLQRRLAAMMVPGAQSSLSAPMAASAAGSAYAEGDGAMAAALKGGLALASEKLPLTAGQAIRDMVLHIPAPVRAQVLADAGKRLLATGAEITTKGLTGAIQESFNTIGGNAVDIHVSGKDKGLLDDAGRSALVGGVLGTVPSGSKGTRVQAAPHRPGPDSPVGHAQQGPPDAYNPVLDNSAGAAERGSGYGDDLLRSLVQGQPVTPVASAVPQAVDSSSMERNAQPLPSGHMDELAAPAVPGGEAGTIAHQTGAEVADAQQEIVPYSHVALPQGTSAPESTADAAVEAPVGAMHLSDKGTLSVEGDPWQLDKRLRAAGVDQVWMWTDSVWVAPEQAARAQRVLAQPQPGADSDAVRQPPPSVQMSMREGGMLDVQGDTKAVRQWLEDAGVPRGAMTDGPEGVIVTAGSVERAKRALAAPAPVAPALLSTAQTADHEEEAVPVQDGRSATAPPAPMVATKLETGVLKIKGDPKKILAVLRNGGVTNVKVRKKEVTVWANEAALAQEILADNNLAGDPAGTETAPTSNGMKEFDGAGPGAAADDFSNLGLSDLGPKLGEGGTKDVFAYGEKYAVGVLHSGRISELESELKLLGQLKEMGLPVVNARGRSW